MQGGEDRMELILGVSWSSKRFITWPSLERCKQRAQSEGQVLMNLEGLNLTVEPRGRAKYSWVFGYGGILFLLNRKEEPEGEYGNARVEIGSLALMQYGVDRCMAMVRNVFHKLGGRVDWDRIQRVDPCLDMPGDDASAFIVDVSAGRAVIRARHKSQYDVREGSGWRTSGLVIGRGDVTLRMYDKVRELEDKPSGAVEKRAWLCENRWGGTMPNRAWRIEFQVRAAPLRSLGVETVADWKQKRAAVVAYLTHEWFRVLDDRPTKGNQRRTDTSELWEQVQQGFADWAGSVAYRVRRAFTRVADSFGPLERRVKAAVTSLIGAAQVESRGVLEWKDAFEVVYGLVEETYQRGEALGWFGEAWNRNQAKIAKTAILPSRVTTSWCDKGVAGRTYDEHGEVYLEDDLEFAF